nr:uncharacterized protein LOC124215865 [Neodiprion pinetum]
MQPGKTRHPGQALDGSCAPGPLPGETRLQGKRSVVPALQVDQPAKLDFRQRTRRWRTTRRETRRTRQTERMRICAQYNPRWLAVVAGGGWGWLVVVGGGRGGGRGRQEEQGGRGGQGFVLGITQDGHEWLLKVVGGAWRWSEVYDEEDDNLCTVG